MHGRTSSEKKEYPTGVMITQGQISLYRDSEKNIDQKRNPESDTCIASRVFNFSIFYAII